MSRTNEGKWGEERLLAYVCKTGVSVGQRGGGVRVCMCVCVCVNVLFRSGDQGSPSCKLLEPGQMVNLRSARGKTTTRDTGYIVSCVLQLLK